MRKSNANTSDKKETCILMTDSYIIDISLKYMYHITMVTPYGICCKTKAKVMCRNTTVFSMLNYLSLTTKVAVSKIIMTGVSIRLNILYKMFCVNTYNNCRHIYSANRFNIEPNCLNECSV